MKEKLSVKIAAIVAILVLIVLAAMIGVFVAISPNYISGAAEWTLGEVYSAYSGLITAFIITAAICVALVTVIVYLILRRNFRPINDLIKAAEEIEKGHLGVSVEVRSKDEIGRLAMSFMKMTARLNLIFDDIHYLLNELASKNFDIMSKHIPEYIGDFQRILLDMRDIKQTLNVTLLKIRDTSEQVSTGSSLLSAGAQSLAQNVTQQAAATQELSASINQISMDIGDTAKNAVNVSEITNEVHAVMGDSLMEMHQLLDAMADISEASKNIGKVIKDIDDIAFQTNILALNAAVEAASAGAAGKGFAVVADEVKNLAQKSSVSAKNTTALIETAVSAVGKGVLLANSANQVFENVSEKTSNINKLVSEISAATETQAGSIEQIRITVEQISNVVQTNSATAEESAASSQGLSAQADALNNLVNEFELDNRLMNK